MANGEDVYGSHKEGVVVHARFWWVSVIIYPITRETEFNGVEANLYSKGIAFSAATGGDRLSCKE